MWTAPKKKKVVLAEPDCDPFKKNPLLGCGGSWKEVYRSGDLNMKK